MSTKIQSEVRSTTFEKAKLLQQTSPRFCFQNVALRILSIFFCMISPTIIQTFYLKKLAACELVLGFGRSHTKCARSTYPATAVNRTLYLNFLANEKRLSEG